MIEHNWSEKECLDCLSHEAIGVELSRNVARKLRSGKSIYNQHRDYCGHGLTYKEGKYCFIVVHDGWLGYSEVIASFDSEESFVSFLSRQSDFTLSGASMQEPVFYTEDRFLLNNQRLTKKALGSGAVFRT
ncbi:hypothetical protein P886_3400 [Alteromonadaceae bacterium 2753L.S.0a.02]|nr:hypothetical protein P886_3400 [Alteromonadaceae bacterium 2753L.S.0a.02]